MSPSWPPVNHPDWWDMPVAMTAHGLTRNCPVAWLDEPAMEAIWLTILHAQMEVYEVRLISCWNQVRIRFQNDSRESSLLQWHDFWENISCSKMPWKCIVQSYNPLFFEGHQMYPHSREHFMEGTCPQSTEDFRGLFIIYLNIGSFNLLVNY